MPDRTDIAEMAEVANVALPAAGDEDEHVAHHVVIAHG